MAPERTCFICRGWVADLAYPNLVCHDCDGSATDLDGTPLVGRWREDTEIPPDVTRRPDGVMFIHNYDGQGVNPVLIDGVQCWRRYRFGGWITMADPDSCEHVGQFRRIYSPPIPEKEGEPEMTEVEMQETLEQFRRSLATPNAARLYGFESDEVKLNHALHVLFAGPAGQALLQGLARRVGDGFGPVWQGVVRGDYPMAEPIFQPGLTDKKRGDERVRLDGIDAEVLIELKVEADGGDQQLLDYVQQQPGVLLPLLMDLGGTHDDHGDDVPVLVAADYLDALDDVLEGDLDAAWRAVVADHRNTIEYLHLRDVVVRKLDVHEALRGTEGVLGEWIKRDWRWVHKAAAHEIRVRLQKALGPTVKRVAVHHDYVGSAVDVVLHTPASFGQDIVLFVKWRIGKGVGLHVGAWGASDPWATVAVVRRQLLDPVHEALRPLSEKKPVVSNRKGKSGLIVRAVADDWGVQAGVDSCLSALRAIESVLAGVGH